MAWFPAFEGPVISRLSDRFRATVLLNAYSSNHLIRRSLCFFFFFFDRSCRDIMEMITMELGSSVGLMNFEMQYAYFSIRHLLSVWVVGSCINA